jgi:MoaA/NifB/PqqE/SkfB family radical SAM enzyme
MAKIDGLEEFEKLIPNVTFPGAVEGGRIETLGWYVHEPKAGVLYTLDIEHIPDEVVRLHNDPSTRQSAGSLYRETLCVHACPGCFNEENRVYVKYKVDFNGTIAVDSNGNPIINKIMTLEDTFRVIDQAISIARAGGGMIECVKFLGPGELLLNPQLFEIIDEYAKRGIHLSIFTKGAVLGSDEHAIKYHGMTAKELVDKLAACENVSLLFSFQSFDGKKQESLVSSRDEAGGAKGLAGYDEIRKRALKHILSSEFYKNGKTSRLCIINTPVVPENIDEAFAIYKFFVERGIPVVMTISMLSGKGCGLVDGQDEAMSRGEWHSKVVELYAQVYAFSIQKRILTLEQVREEGISSYPGAMPCNQASIGLYVRANGIVQMCPGRFDEETVFGELEDKPLKEIWEGSPNRRRGLTDPQALRNNHCPAKDDRDKGFPKGFYERVMKRLEEILSERRMAEMERMSARRSAAPKASDLRKNAPQEPKMPLKRPKGPRKGII